tara:strand:+ start:14247 stop:16115 length:1869 start_codon:yes stop_codon:yes gene_type:complete
MAGLIPQGFIDDLLGRTDIVEVVGSRLKLKKTGKNFSALCPFHNEKSPSFSVSPDKQFYYCFGCGAGGNALSFVMDFERLDFPQAVEDLARQAGVDVPREEQRPGSQREPRTPRQDSPLYALLEQAAAYYRQQLRHHAQKRRAVDYLKQRGLTGQIAKRYDIGFAPPGWNNLMGHLSKDSTEVKALVEAGLVVENEEGRRYDRFRDRIIFPIRDSRGRTLGFGGRVLGDDKPKYLNSPETPVYHKGRELYGLFEARQQNRQLDDVLVVEGYMDVIALAQHGVTNAVATLGTATSEEHLKRLFRIVNTVVFCFDGDKAGRQAAWRALNACLPVLEDGRHVRFMFLPEGQDPDTLIRSEGQDAFRARMAQQAQALTDYLFRHLSEEANPNTLEGKAHLATLALPLIEQIPGSMLKRLLRQSLEKLTGMDLDSLPPPPPPPPASADDYADYQDVEPEGWAGSQDFQPRRAPQRSSKPRKAERAGVENPLLNAARTLLHHPQLAGLVTEANQFAAEEGEQAQLLVGLIEALQKTPTLSTVQLLARWHGTEMGEQLSQLAEKEWLLNIPDANLEQQFFDTINSLVARQTERRIEQLLDKSAHTPLTTEEKQQLRELLHRRPAHASDQ